MGCELLKILEQRIKEKLPCVDVELIGDYYGEYIYCKFNDIDIQIAEYVGVPDAKQGCLNLNIVDEQKHHEYDFEWDLLNPDFDPEQSMSAITDYIWSYIYGV